LSDGKKSANLPANVSFFGLFRHAIGRRTMPFLGFREKIQARILFQKLFAEKW
jgi:hypothetical protein